MLKKIPFYDTINLLKNKRERKMKRKENNSKKTRSSTSQKSKKIRQWVKGIMPITSSERTLEIACRYFEERFQSLERI